MTCFGSWVARIDLNTKALLHHFLKSTNIILYLKENAPWQVVRLRDNLKGQFLRESCFGFVSEKRKRSTV